MAKLLPVFDRLRIYDEGQLGVMAEASVLRNQQEVIAAHSGHFESGFRIPLVISKKGIETLNDGVQGFQLQPTVSLCP